MTDRTHVLRADLTAKTVERERVPERWRRRFLGGKGLGARYLYEELDAGVDPLGPDNLLAFCVGPLSGSLPGEPRYAAVTKSPLTGLFLDSYAGGTFASRLAGSLDDCLALIVAGEGDEPVRIEVADGTAAIVPAETWGEDTAETAAAHPDTAVACVGPAGEMGVRYATIASDGGEHHAGRGGAGAVMGAKRLKAVIATGPAAEPPTAELAALRESHRGRYIDGDVGRWQAAAGTLESVDFANEVGALAANGWRSGRFEGADGVGIEAARSAAIGREYPDGDGDTDRDGDANHGGNGDRDSDANHGGNGDRDGDVPGGFRVETADGETVPRGAASMTLGAGLDVGDFDAVAALGGRCDRLGIDVIGAGSAVAWAARASEEGVVDADVSFGDPEAASALIAAIATGNGGHVDLDDDDNDDDDLLNALRRGVDAAADRFDFDPVPTVKSMVLPGYDPRASAGMALAYATSDRGGCHRRARPIEEEVFAAWDDGDRVEAVVTAQDTRSTLWSLVADDFAGETLWPDCGAAFAEAHADATGSAIPTTPAALRRCGERIWTLIRLFNAREGAGRGDDALPELFAEPIADGPAKGSRIDPEEFDRLLDAYYRVRGWNADGCPTATTLERLGLDAPPDASKATR